MDEKYYWPLVGVLLGWVLNTISNHSKYRIEQKLRSGKALTYLMIVHGQLSLMNRHLDKIKEMTSSWKAYETLRANQVDKHLLASEDLQNNIESAFIELSGVNPLLAHKLIGIKQLLAKYRAIQMGRSSKSVEVYLHLLAAHETVNELLVHCKLNC